MSEIHLPEKERETMSKICDVGTDKVFPEIREVQDSDVNKALRRLTEGMQTLACGFATGYVDHRQLVQNADNIRSASAQLPPRLNEGDSELVTKVCDINGREVVPLIDQLQDYREISEIPAYFDVKSTMGCALNAVQDVACNYKELAKEPAASLRIDETAMLESADCIERFAETLNSLKQSGMQKSYLEKYGPLHPPRE